jgi:hypothetical protein
MRKSEKSQPFWPDSFLTYGNLYMNLLIRNYFSEEAIFLRKSITSGKCRIYNSLANTFKLTFASKNVLLNLPNVSSGTRIDSAGFGLYQRLVNICKVAEKVYFIGCKEYLRYKVPLR